VGDEIDGVWVKDVSVVPDERGRLMELPWDIVFK
jgi:dTDP-4-dehydrorhamnose 3,5-epimerase-like enzyme